MHGISRSSGSRLVRAAVLSVGVLALAGCAAGYTFVQPVGDTGGYYTSSGPYPVPGYYAGSLGVYGPYGANFGYGSYYGSSFTFGVGFGNACGWGCAGYYGAWPWYGYGPGYYGWGWRHGHRYGDPVASGPSPRPWLEPDHPRVPPVAPVSGAAHPLAVPARPMEGVARRPLGSASFAPRGPGRLPQPVRTTDGVAYMAPQSPAYAGRPIQEAAPHDFTRPAAPAAVPMRAAPARTRSNHATQEKIP